MVRPGKRPSPKGQVQARPAQVFSFPAPLRGLSLSENIAMPSPGGARVLDNWTCTTTGIKPRGGTSLFATLAAAATSLFCYRSGGTEAFFGATAAGVYNITTGTPVAAFTGQTGGAYSIEQFGTAGGDYLYAVNGLDKARLFDGSTWTQIDGVSTPAITGVATTALSYVWAFASRLFFVEKGTMNAWYLPVDSIGGAAAAFSLAGIFKQGGSLLFGATWSLDAGDGLDDKCVFVSDQGEVAVYEGTNPGSADISAWRKAGVYNISRPVGGLMQAGGDLLVATEVGLVPLSQAIQRDIAALELGAVSRSISPIWQRKARVTRGQPWEIVKWPAENIMIVSQPDDRTCLVANLQTGAWSRFTGLDVQHVTRFDNAVFFAGRDGKVYRMESGGSDAGAPYTCTYLGVHEGMGAPGVTKTVAQMRATFRASTPVNPQVTAQMDYGEELTPPPAAAGDGATGNLWDNGEWEVAIWSGGETVSRTIALWSAIGRTGYAVAPEVQITCGNTVKPGVELVQIEATYHLGGVVV